MQELHPKLPDIIYYKHKFIPENATDR